MSKTPTTIGNTQKEMEYGNPRIVEPDNDGCGIFFLGFVVGVSLPVLAWFLIVFS